VLVFKTVGFILYPVVKIMNQNYVRCNVLSIPREGYFR
jgi:hypothetical protein